MFGLQRPRALACALCLVLTASGVAAQIPSRDAVSDGVGATFGEFRVDETGNSSYSIPIYAPPGTAGVAPKIALTYNSGAGNGWLGKGWSISGLSAITRCRRTREAGDFYSVTYPVDGNPIPISYGNGDVFCLDGARLLAAYAMDGQDGLEYRVELDPYTKVTSFGGNNDSTTYTGPQYFKVQRKDGSTSYYGNTTDSRILASCAASTSRICTGVIAASWAMNRFEDSTGNYIDYTYETPGFTYVSKGVEYFPESITWTGKRQLPGQSTAGSPPYAGIFFHSVLRAPAAGQDSSHGWLGGLAFTQSHELTGIEVKDQIDSSPRTLRYYKPTYSETASGSGVQHLRSLKECRTDPTNNAAAVCYRPTTFNWSDQDGASYSFDSNYNVNSSESRDLVSSRIGDVDGDGRADIVAFRAAGDTNTACLRGNLSVVSFGDATDSAGSMQLTLHTPAQNSYCTFLNASSGELDSAWGLMDFDGDGLDDLLIADDHADPRAIDDGGSRWHIFRSLGRHAGQAGFDFTNDLINVTISTQDDNTEQAQLGDFNGDGLIDFLYPVSSTELAIRFLERSGSGGFAFSHAYKVTLPTTATGCDAPTCNRNVFNTGQGRFGVAPDLNGDGRSDIVMRVQRVLQQDSPTFARDTFFAQDVLEQMAVVQGFNLGKAQFFAMVMDEKVQSPPAQKVKFYGASNEARPLHTYNDESNTSAGPTSARQFQFADFNGDGLVDLLYQPDLKVQNLRYAINRGDRFEGNFNYAYSGDLWNVPSLQQLQTADINGDGRAEILFPSSIANPCPGTFGARAYRYLTFDYANHANGSFGQIGSSAETTGNCIPGGKVVAADLNKFQSYFADFDGDGSLDFLRLQSSNVAPFAYTVRTSSRFKAKDVVTRITNGHGAITRISYQPLTNAAIYRRDHRSHVLYWGRGSPVLDVLGAQYVVSMVSSSAPLKGLLSHESTIRYRYSGAKVQTGGRGMLGFASITTFDGALVSGRWTATDQLYRQDFPFVGSPLQTVKWVVTGPVSRGDAGLNACALDPEAPGYLCFYNHAAADKSHPQFDNPLYFNGSMVRYSASLWGCKANGITETCDFPIGTPSDSCPDLSGAGASSLGLGQSPFSPPMSSYSDPPPPETDAPLPYNASTPIFSYVPRTVDVDFDPLTGTVTRHVCGLFYYGDGYGNNTSGSVTTFSGLALSTEVAKKSTTNTYVNDDANWRLGRLTTSLIDDTRGGSTRSRVTDFEYEVDRPGYASVTNTGLLKSERVQANVADNQDLRTLYTLDEYGNRTHEFHCSRLKVDGSVMTDNDCRNVNLVQQRPLGASGPTTAVHRYVRRTFAQNGRYESTAVSPFYSPTAPRNVFEQASQIVNDRDEFGNPTSVTGTSSLTSVSEFGALNRAYYASDSTGKAVTTTFRWCGSAGDDVSCPSSANFRQRTAANGGLTSFTYFDRLGRAVLTATESFKAGEAGKNWSAACTSYDNHGRSVFVSVPFFLPASFGAAADPFFSSSADPCAAAIAGTTTTYDVLGRVTQLDAPDGSDTFTAFTDLTTKVTDSRGQQISQTKNALGEVVTIVQADAATGALSGETLVVTHEYDASGNLRFVRRNPGNGEVTSEVEYDSLGRRSRLIDPDRGATSYEYNAAGEVIRTTNALSSRVDHDIDALGRVWRTRAGNATAFNIAADAIFIDGFEDAGFVNVLIVTDEWQYDTAGNGLGKLDFERRQISTETSVAFYRSYQYDSLGRLQMRSTSFDGSTYDETTSYDAFGRVSTKTDASGDVTTTSYTGRGFLDSLSYSLAGVGAAGVFYKVNAHDAWGHVTEEVRAGSFATTLGYDQQRGWVDSVSTPAGSAQNWNYDFDTNGNLTKRNRGGSALIEALQYDKLNRLTHVARSGTLTPAATTLVTYDKLGNVCTKGLLTYTYEGLAYGGPGGCATTGTQGRPHVVAQVGSVSYMHDGLGNRTFANAANDPDDHTVGYDVHEQASHFTRGDFMAPVPPFEAEFVYGPDRARYRRIDRVDDTITRTTRYVGNVEIIIMGSVVQTKRYLGGGAIVTTASGSPIEERYALTDHLGSPDVVVNKTGAVQESSSFDAWGLRRNASNWTFPGTALATTTRGFTGHEHLDAIGLIHMNGRIYDPVIGRFVQSDPLVDAGIQGLNRYSYVLNNPLSMTDPTGHLSWGEWMRVGIGIGVTIATSGAASGTWSSLALTAGQKAFVVGAGGALIGAANSQSLKGAAWGAVSALGFYGIGSYFESASWAHNGSPVFGTNLDFGGYAAKVLAHGVAGGTLQHLQGGRFGSGFAAAGITQAFSGGIGTIDPANPGFSPAEALVAAMLGGAASDLTGGKFAHGAVTAAFAYAFNEAMHDSALDIDPEGAPRGFVADVQAVRNEAANSGVSVFEDADSAPFPITIRASTHTRFRFQGGKAVVDWNPREGLVVQKAGGHRYGEQSPALGLVHEVAHAVDFVRNRASYARMGGKITLSETYPMQVEAAWAATHRSEPIRNPAAPHNGAPFQARGLFSARQTIQSIR